MNALLGVHTDYHPPCSFIHARASKLELGRHVHHRVAYSTSLLLHGRPYPRSAAACAVTELYHRRSGRLEFAVHRWDHRTYIGVVGGGVGGSCAFAVAAAVLQSLFYKREVPFGLCFVVVVRGNVGCGHVPAQDPRRVRRGRGQSDRYVAASSNYRGLPANVLWLESSKSDRQAPPNGLVDGIDGIRSHTHPRADAALCACFDCIGCLSGAYDDPNGSHVSIEVVSSMFEGKRPVQRQQLVYKAIWEELQGPVHAVDSMVCKTPSEAAAAASSS